MKQLIPLTECPIGLLPEAGSIERFPLRKREIIDHAIRTREELRVLYRASRSRFGWHPLHTAKVIMMFGIATFAFAWLFSYVSAFGHWYASAKAWNISVPIPLIGSRSIPIGSVMPTSTSLGVASQFPVYGWKESVYASMSVIFVVIVERLILAAVNVRSFRVVHAAERELDAEIAVLRGWMDER